MSRIEKLMYSISVIDKATNPVAKITDQVDKLQSRAREGMRNIFTGAAGLVGSGFALKSMMSPAIEMDRALGEVRSLGVTEDALKTLTKTALDFSIQYGESATDVVAASYDIQSAISGLSGFELSEFTKNSAILAKATKSDTGTITDYMGTMYGIFEKQAQQMGKAEWVQALTGQTATAVQMFKTTGDKMSSAFSQLGSSAQVAGIGMSEQMAVLGQLQATMSGSEAGTKYKAFLGGIGKAQESLGLSFTDSQGHMLSTVEILDRISGKFTDMESVEAQDALKKAFGSKQAVGFITSLIGKTDQLKTNIDTLSAVSSTDKAVDMASNIADPWERLEHGIKAVSISFWSLLQPAIHSVLNTFTDGTQTLVRWINLFPNLAKALGFATLGVFGVIAGVSALNIVIGIGKMMMAGFSTAMIFSQGIMLLFKGVLKGFIFTVRVLQGALFLARWAMMALNASVLMSPIGLAMAAIAVAIGAVVYFWDDLKAAGVSALETLSGWISNFGAIAGDVWDSVSASFMGSIQTVLGVFGNIPAAFVKLKNWFSNFDLFAALGDAADWIIEKLNMIPGIDIETSQSHTQTVDQQIKQPNVPPLDQPAMGAGSLMPTVGAEQTPIPTMLSPMINSYAPETPVPLVAVNNPAYEPSAPVVNTYVPEMTAPVVNTNVPELPAPFVAVNSPEYQQPITLINTITPEQPATVVNTNIPRFEAPAPVVNTNVPEMPAPYVAVNSPVYEPPALTVVEQANTAREETKLELPKLQKQSEYKPPQGGLMQQINNARNTAKSNHIENLTIHSPTPVDGRTLQDEFEMVAG